MSLAIPLVLGLIQGLTEFFPISSSAHLKLAKMLFGITSTSIMFDLSCHLGTLLALIWFFKGEIWKLLTSNRKEILHLALALLPLFPSYFLLKSARESLSDPRYLGLFLAVTGAILLIGQHIQFHRRGGTFGDMLIIGAMQATALIPGISRSASTISCAKVLGWSTRKAVRFSFLLAIPTIVGGNLVEMRRLSTLGELSKGLNLECVIGLLTSFSVGLGVIRFAMHMLEREKLSIFAWYCFGIGTLTSLYLFKST